MKIKSLFISLWLLVIGALSSGSGALSLEWTYPASLTNINDSDTVVFEIWSTTDLSQPFTELPTVPYQAGVTNYSYLISNVLPAQFFKVRAFDETTGQESGWATH